MDNLSVRCRYLTLERVSDASSSGNLPWVLLRFLFIIIMEGGLWVMAWVDENVIWMRLAGFLSLIWWMVNMIGVYDRGSNKTLITKATTLLLLLIIE